MTKIGLIREGKVPKDHRVPVTPVQAKHIKLRFPEVDIVAQSSDVRCYSDQDYVDQGIEIVTDVSDCDILMGVKEVPLDELIEGKTYLFFSHTIKKQAYNQKLLRAILDKKIRLVDYETLTDDKGMRIIAFGRWAGIVGAYNAVWAYGQRSGEFVIRRAHECFDLQDLIGEVKKVSLPKVKMVVTGGGRVAHGAMEILHALHVKQISPAQFLSDEFDHTVFTQLDPQDYNRKPDNSSFTLDEFFKNPEQFLGDFQKYTKVADVLIASAFWDPKAPVLFTRQDASANDFAIRVIADITCDIEGSIPSTKRASTIADPIYDYNPAEDREEAPLSGDNNITVMAVDNLPCELPRDASESFGEQLIENVLPHLLGDDHSGVVKRATIAESGNLTSKYEYLRDYVEGR